MTNPAAPNTALDVAYIGATRRIALAYNSERINYDTRNEALQYAFNTYEYAVSHPHSGIPGSATRALDAIERD